MTEVYQSKKLLRDDFDTLVNLRDRHTDTGKYRLPGEEGRGQFHVILPRHRFSSADSQNGRGQYVDPEESQYFHLMDRIEVEELIAPVLEEIEGFEGSNRMHVKTLADYFPEGMGEPHYVDWEGSSYSRLSIDNPLLEATVPVHVEEVVEKYSILDAVDTDYDGALLVDRTGEIYPWTVEVVPSETFPERYREDWGMKHRSALNISAGELEVDGFSELDYVREFPESGMEAIDSLIEGGVVDRFSEEGWGDIVTLTLSSETGQVSVFDKGDLVVATEPVASRSEGVVERMNDQSEQGYEYDREDTGMDASNLRPVPAASD